MHGSLLLHSRPLSAPAILHGVACIIPTVDRNTPLMTIAPSCKSTVSQALMGRRGNPYDNAKAESFMKTLKVEAVYLMHTKPSRMSQPTFHASSTRFTTPADSTPR